MRKAATDCGKFFLKSILDNLLNNTPDENGQLIFYSDLFAKFAESFWNLVVKYHLHQQKPTGEGKTSKIEQIFNEATAKNPLLENLEFASIEENTKSKLIQKVQAECRKYVLGALYGEFTGTLGLLLKLLAKEIPFLPSPSVENMPSLKSKSNSTFSPL